jgi:hypothetical protein
VASPIREFLRDDHDRLDALLERALAPVGESLLVPTPAREIAAEIASILGPHSRIEEEPGGLHDVGDALLATRAIDLVERMRAYPAVKVAPYKDGPGVHRTAASALANSARQAQAAGAAADGRE